MDKGSYVAVSGSMGHERNMDIISNNLANINTAGFKADRLIFESYLKKSMSPAADVPASGDLKTGAGMSKNDSEFLLSAEAYTDHSQGSLRQTESPLDFAISGDGFFVVHTANGERYSRGGTFAIGQNGEIVNQEGNPLLNEEGKYIYLDDQSFYVKTDGTIMSDKNLEIDKFKLVSFEDKSVLKKEGNSLYSVSDVKYGDWSEGKVQQGFLESSNINAVAEMTRMITALRSYQSFQKVIQSNNEMTTRLISDVGK